MKEMFDEDYFERGVELGISGYTNYHWRPEYVMSLANNLKKDFCLPGYTVLDFGCAKGYLVKALRLLSINAFGFDISSYAISTADPFVKNVVSDKWDSSATYDIIIAKDVLEHIPKDKLQEWLVKIRKAVTDKVIVIVPLGDNNQFRIREYSLDKTHVNMEDEEWWINQFTQAGFSISAFYYDYPGAKDHWLKIHPFGNAMFVLGVK